MRGFVRGEGGGWVEEAMGKQAVNKYLSPLSRRDLFFFPFSTCFFTELLD